MFYQTPKQIVKHFNFDKNLEFDATSNVSFRSINLPAKVV